MVTRLSQEIKKNECDFDSLLLPILEMFCIFISITRFNLPKFSKTKYHKKLCKTTHVFCC